MSFDLQKVLESKRAMRRSLVVMPLTEKFRMLDALREREIAIRGSSVHSESAAVREPPAAFCKRPA